MLLQTVSQIAPLIQSQCVVLTDARLLELWGEALRAALPPSTLYLTVPAGEEAKQIEVATRIWQTLHLKGIDRSALLIGVGGGAICDLTGFIAGCYLRGVDCALVPTSLLAMVDAAIGGKCGVNTTTGKNIVGLFQEPAALVIDPSFLSTLPKRELQSGMAEIIKAALIADPSLFSHLETGAASLDEAIRRSIDIKKTIVAQDERERSGKRALLNLGHTFAHALETAAGHGTLLHGEAVAIGLAAAARVSVEILNMPIEVASRIEECLRRHELPTRLPPGLSVEHIVDLMRRDKKQRFDSKGQTLVLLREIGDVQLVHGVDRSSLVAALT